MGDKSQIGEPHRTSVERVPLASGLGTGELAGTVIGPQRREEITLLASAESAGNGTRTK